MTLRKITIAQSREYPTYSNGDRWIKSLQKIRKKIIKKL